MVNFAFFIQSQEEITSHFEKIYVRPSQICIFPEGIFFMNDQGVPERCSLISLDNNGLYIITAYYQCPGCGRWNNDGICLNKQCSLYGK